MGASKNTAYATQSSTASSSKVTAPDYTLDLTAMGIQADNLAVVQSVSGEAAARATARVPSLARGSCSFIRAGCELFANRVLVSEVPRLRSATTLSYRSSGV